MARILIDVDERHPAAAQQALHTETENDTVNAALREVIALVARRRDVLRLLSANPADPEAR